MKQATVILTLICLLFITTACSQNHTASDSQGTMETHETSDNTEDVSDTGEEDSTQADGDQNEIDEENGMVIVWNGTEYAVQVEDSVTARDIAEKLPMELAMTQYGGHEYYSELDFRPEFAEDRTSQIEAGHIYYWDGWNAFVINYIDWDISPYEVVHIGEITDKSIVDELLQADGDITVTVR